ncbi:MAG: hypothetical protein IPH27_02485 [Actinomycetales bacterium]|nr:hypothetical protein [Candidatus Phosphoribacter baldrii]
MAGSDIVAVATSAEALLTEALPAEALLGTSSRCCAGSQATGPSDPALGPAAAVISQARELSQSAGVPLADSWEAAAGLLREHEAVRRRVAVALAGPRATMRILTLLPLAGPLVGAVFAVDPWRMYAGSPIAIGCLGLGLALLGIGRWWCSLLIRRLGLAAVT